MKRFFQKPLLWLFGVTIVSAGSGLAMLNLANPTNVAETAPDSKDAALRSRRYPIKGDIQQMRREIEAIVPSVSTKIWGGKWQLVGGQNTDSDPDKETVRVMVPVVFFTDDLQITLRKDGDSAVVNVRSASRVGKSDFGENRRHVLQILKKMDEKFDQE